MMNHTLAGFALALAIACAAKAQVIYGSLTGTVGDLVGAVIPGAPTKVTNTATAQEFTTRTNEAGGYTFSNLTPGNYELVVSANGFRGFTRRDIAVAVNIVRREDVTLEVGQLNESITVEAGAAVLQTDKADVNTELGSRDVLNMPLPHYRNYRICCKRPAVVLVG